MRCAKATRQLQLYIDGRLTLKQMRELEMHLSDCPSCREELFLLEEIEQALQTIEVVAEPPNLTASIMRRVALTPQYQEAPSYSVLLRPSLSEVLAIIALATIATLGLILSQPALREMLPVANGHDLLSLVFINILHAFANVSANTVMLLFWVIGTFLGIWITLVLAGSEMRSQWFKAMMERLPVW